MDTKKQSDGKINYVPPTILDLGDITPLTGAICTSGIGDICTTGAVNLIGTGCEDGTYADVCAKGSAEDTPDPT